MINAVAEAIYEINENRSRPIQIFPKYFFIEQDKKNYEYLQHSISCKCRENNDIILKNTDFNIHLREIITDIKNRNPRGGGGAIFFLDQDGYASVKLDGLRLIHKELPKAEVIININISWLIDFIDDSNRFKNTINGMGLSNFLDLDEIIRLKQESPDNRYIIESKLSIAIQQATEFPYFRPFFIEPSKNHRGYWLLHLSSHYRAHNAMSELVWEKGNYMRHYGGDGAQIFELSYKGKWRDYRFWRNL